MAWTQRADQDVTPDRRGWPRGTPRRYTAKTAEQVLELHDRLERTPQVFFTGATAIAHEWRTRYPDEPPPSLRFIGRTLRAHGRTHREQPKRHGAARYLAYPARTLAGLGRTTLEIDFIGRKYIDGRTAPVCFIAFSLRGPRILKYFKRIESESADQAIPVCREFFQRFERPEVAKVDNGFGFAASSRWPRTVGPMMRFLLREHVTPVFTAPRRPWNQASVEGANSVFGRKFWRRFRFRSVLEVDRELGRFNAAYEQYTGYRTPSRTRRSRPFTPTVYYIRKVQEHPRRRAAMIDLANEQVFVPRDYLGLFVLARWELAHNRLAILLERGERTVVIHRQPFVLHEMSRWRLSGFI